MLSWVLGFPFFIRKTLIILEGIILHYEKGRIIHFDHLCTQYMSDLWLEFRVRHSHYYTSRDTIASPGMMTAVVSGIQCQIQVQVYE